MRPRRPDCHAERRVRDGTAARHDARARRTGARQPRLAAAHLGRAARSATGTHGSGDQQRQPRHGGRGARVDNRGRRSPDCQTWRPGVRRRSLSASERSGRLSESRSTSSPPTDVRQRVFEDLPLRVLLESFDAVMSAGYSVSLFTVWDGTIDQVWVKRRVVPGQEEVELTLPGAEAGDPEPPSDPRARSDQRHAAAGRARGVVGPAAALPDGLHPE